MLEIRTFGTLVIRDRLADADLPAILSRPKRAALLTYLASARPYGFHRRDELFGLFWPDLPQRNARKALNQSVYVLRSLIGRDVIVSRRGEDIGLNRSAVWSDAVAFGQAVERADHGTALGLYVGEFLTAFHLPDAPAFERWLDAEREHYRRRAVDSAVALADAEAAAGEHARAAERLRWALEKSPYDEAMLVRLLRLLAATGDETGARRELQRFETRFEAELGLEISPATRAMVRQRASTQVAGSRQDGAAPSTQTADDGPSGSSMVNARPASAQSIEDLMRSGRPRRAARSRRAAGVAVVASVVGIALFQANRSDGSASPAPTEPVRVMVSALENRTGSPDLNALGRIAADWVTRGLLRTGLVGVVPVSSTDVTELASSNDTPMDLVFSGAFHRESGRLVIEARIVDLESRTVVRSLEPIGAEETDPLPALERLRQHATGALATLVDPRFADWADDASQPPSFEAYLEYVAGMERLERGDYSGAAERFLAAAGRDSSFTSALLWAIQSYGLVGQGPRDSLALALEPAREGLPAWDRAMLDFHLADMRYDNLGAYQAMQHIVRLSPTPQWRILLAERARRINRPVEAFHLVSGIRPEQVTGIPASLYWIVLGNSYHSMGMFEKELAHANRWQSESPGSGQLFEFSALAGLGRGEDVVRLVLELSREWAWTYSRAELLRRVALELRAHGQLEHARAVLERSFALYAAADDSVRRDPESRLVIGRSLYVANRWEESRALFTRLLDEGHRTTVVRGDIGIAAARLGDRKAAEAIIDWYTRWARENPRHGGWATQWRARIAAALGDRDAALRWLQQAHAEGWPFSFWDHRTEEYENLRGYAPFEELMRPAG